MIAEGFYLYLDPFAIAPLCTEFISCKLLSTANHYNTATVKFSLTTVKYYKTGSRFWIFWQA